MGGFAQRVMSLCTPSSEFPLEYCTFLVVSTGRRRKCERNAAERGRLQGDRRSGRRHRRGGCGDYRVSHLVGHLGCTWSLSAPISARFYMGRRLVQWNIQIPSQPNPGARPDDSPCSSAEANATIHKGVVEEEMDWAVTGPPVEDFTGVMGELK